MSAISEYAGKVDEHLEKIGTGIDDINTGIGGIDIDLQELKKLIEQLQNTPGQITPEDQALLDAIQAKAASLAEKSATTAAIVKALDDLTPPPAPPVV